MKKKRIFSLILVLVFCLNALVAVPVLASEPDTPSDAAADDAESTPDSESESGTDETGESESDAESEAPEEANAGTFSVDAGAALLLEMNSGSIAYEKNIDDKIFPASLTKIMTCMLVLENGNLDDMVTVSESALAGLDPDGSAIGLEVGETLRLEDLLYCIMLPSANDGCTVVAEHIGGTIDGFVDMMNEKAAALGCTGTHFANPDGLHDDEHYTTVRDLSIITQAALEDERFVKISSTSIYELPATNLSDARTLYTTNYLTSNAINPNYYYEQASGIKTGYTSQAGRCLISTAKSEQFYYLSIVVGCETTYDEYGDPVYQNFVQSKKLLEHGLNDFTFVTVLSDLAPIAQVPVTHAKASSTVIAPNTQIIALLPTDYDPEQVVTTYKLTGGETSLQAPLEAGEVVGTVTASYQGQELGSADVVTITAIDRSEVAYTAKVTGNFLQRYWWVILIAVIVLIVLIRLSRPKPRKRRSVRRRSAPQQRSNPQRRERPAPSAPRSGRPNPPHSERGRRNG